MQELTPQPVEPIKDTLDELSAVEAILNPAPEKVQDTAPGGDPKAEDPGQETGPEAVAIDYEQEIPLSSGTKVKLGELKDFYQAQDQKVAELIERENAMLAKAAEVNDYLELLEQIPEAQKAQIRQQQEQLLMTEHKLMLDAIPEWKDQGQFAAGKERIFNLAREYGIQQHLERVSDHRILKMLNDYARMREAVKAAREKVAPAKAPDPKGKQSAPKPQLAGLVQKAKQTGSEADQMAAINTLLRR